ncbi:hypothetical protein V1511DRAFT_501343 [Dipodascopsis uninucleata]
MLFTRTFAKSSIRSVVRIGARRSYSTSGPTEVPPILSAGLLIKATVLSAIGASPIVAFYLSGGQQKVDEPISFEAVKRPIWTGRETVEKPIRAAVAKFVEPEEAAAEDEPAEDEPAAAEAETPVVEETPAAVEEAPAPVDEIPAPVEETPAPVEETPAAVEEATETKEE